MFLLLLLLHERSGEAEWDEEDMCTTIHFFLSFFLPLSLFPSFLGTLWDKHMHAWVATFHFDHEEHRKFGLVKFWETTTGLVYVLKNRFAQPGVLEA
ncbi:c2 domain-containing protein [Cystoisospora suis]|uniref:C2 domain-containing protein n=1 Tax=Cystoisospora suis TaxID=483139 RepID=A0A2C6K9P9_9APIC|nr:c2 domain-containing protein [Cystoisospora suis]